MDLTPLTFTCSRELNLMDNSFGFFHPKRGEKVKVENPSDLKFYGHCMRGREVNNRSSIVGAFRSSRMRLMIEIFFAHGHM